MDLTALPNGPLRVLIADDQPADQLIVPAAIRRLGHECTVVRDADQAWNACLQDPPDVLVVGRDLPGSGGDELIRRVRAQIGPQTQVMSMPPTAEGIERELAVAAAVIAMRRERRRDQELLGLQRAVTRVLAVGGDDAVERTQAAIAAALGWVSTTPRTVGARALTSGRALTEAGAVAVPLLASGGATGVLEFACGDRGRRPDARTLSVLTTIGIQLGQRVARREVAAALR